MGGLKAEYNHKEENKMAKKSKKYVEALNKIDRTRLYDATEALSLVAEVATAKFDETVEAHIKLGVDSRHADQQVRGAVVLPHGTGKTKKVLVLAKGDAAKAATDAGADYVGDVDMITKIEKENWFDFDVIIATPEMMPMLGKLGRVLGPKGLMPNPKTGTVTMDTKKAVEDVKKGRVEYRTDSYANVHALVGKVSFDDEKLVDNVKAFMDVIIKSKPQAAKGIYLKGVSLASTMGPGIKVDLSSFDK